MVSVKRIDGRYDCQADEDAGLDGVDLMPLFERGETPERQRLFWHYPHYYRDFGPHSVLRQGDFKLIRWYESGLSELYNLSSDPREAHDLARAEPELLEQLNAELDTWLRSVDAKLPRR